MCGRFYVDEGTAREIERVIRGVDLRIQKMRTGDIYPSQSADILIFHSQQKNPLPAGSAVENSVSDTKHTVVNLSQSIDILSLYHKGGISNEYKVYR